MRRAVTSLLAVIALAAPLGLALPSPAAARECEGYGCARENYQRTRDLPAYGSRYDGYWDRRGEGRRDRGHHRRYRPDHDRHGGAHYYPGYGYYAADHGHRDGRAAACAERYRSYDWRSGTYVGHDGVRRRCG